MARTPSEQPEQPEQPHTDKQRELASTMLQVARESVSVLKRGAPDQAIKLTRKQEWELYMEVLKVLFNLADRLAAYYVSLQEYPDFMNGLEDAVSEELKNALAPTLQSASGDEMGITITIGNTVAESRQIYERYRFDPLQDTPAKDEYFKAFGERIADKMGDPRNGSIMSSASLCASAVIPAMKALFEGRKPDESQAPPQAEESPEAGAATPGATSGKQSDNVIQLISILASVSNEEIETRWGLHPQFQRDLRPEESKELSMLLNRATRILGERFATIAASGNWTKEHRAGHA